MSSPQDLAEELLDLVANEPIALEEVSELRRDLNQVAEALKKSLASGEVSDG